MTPFEQLAASAVAHASVPHLNDMLSLWECMDAATTTDESDPDRNTALFNLREEVGVAEMRDLCITLYPYLQLTFEAYEAEFGDWDCAFDWTFIPLFIDLIDWAAVSYNNVPGRYYQTFTDLPPPAETARAIHERYTR
jgi:hypothetical protein